MQWFDLMDTILPTGHPLSPDLFKVFLSDLSGLLNMSDCPILSETSISHLLWADDLIMLSLNKETCQSQLDVLDRFCNECQRTQNPDYDCWS